MELGTSETRLPSSSSQPVAVAGFAPGSVFADRYRIVALVGRGGMGEVYRADDLRLGQPVALKFLPAELEADPLARERLLAEVRSARTVSHPNVCRVYDIGDVRRAFLPDDGVHRRGGPGVAAAADRAPAGGQGPRDRAPAVRRGWRPRTSAGVLHRDLKPANVMIDGRGQARITDFGLAVAAEAGARRARAAGVGCRGTPAYMAPERSTARWQPCRAISTRSASCSTRSTPASTR